MFGVHIAIFSWDPGGRVYFRFVFRGKVLVKTYIFQIVISKKNTTNHNLNWHCNMGAKHDATLYSVASCFSSILLHFLEIQGAAFISDLFLLGKLLVKTDTFLISFSKNKNTINHNWNCHYNMGAKHDATLYSAASCLTSLLLYLLEIEGAAFISHLFLVAKC